ncbi:MAG: hypothetical protein AB7H48_07735 [Parachlamydiales bacterium]
MATTPVTHAHLPPSASYEQVQRPTPQAAASQTASTLTSSAAPEDSGGSFCDTIAAFIRNIWDQIQQLLSKIPGFGSLSQQQEDRPEPTTHLGRLEFLYDIFRTADSLSIPPVPTNEQLPRLIEHFRQLTDPVDQAEAFSHIQRSANTTDAIVRAFFDALPAPVQDGIQYNIVLNYARFIAEHNITLERPVIEMGQHTVDNEIRTVHMSAGTVNFVTKLREGSRAQSSASPAMTELNRLELIYDAFRGPDSTGTHPVPTPERTLELIAQFRAIANTIDKVEAFSHIQRSVNATDPIVKSFFDALPAHVQDGIKYHIIRNYIRFNREHSLALFTDPNTRRQDLAQRTVDQEIRTATMSAGIVNYLAALRRT